MGDADHDQPETETGTKPFWCFISYRHADNAEKGREWASWLHHELETFPVPDELVGTLNRRGEALPARIYPVFRDEEELPAFADLSTAIVHALQRSLNLVVLCSPRARESRFVNEEILRFKALGRSDRTYGIIISGDPAADGTDACLPHPLTHRVDARGAILAERDDPLLVDFREETGAEGWIDPAARLAALQGLGLEPKVAAAECAARGARLEEAKLRVIAAVLGVDEDALRQAHQRRLRRERIGRLRTYLTWAALTGLVVAFLVLSVRYAMEARDNASVSSSKSAAERQKAEQIEQDSAAKRELAEGLRIEQRHSDGLALLQAQRHAEAAEAFADAAGHGHPAAAHELAKLRIAGRLGTQDEAGTFALLESAVAKGHAPAMATLGRLLTSGERATNPTDRARGVELLRRSVGLGERAARLDLAKALGPAGGDESRSLVAKLAEEGEPEACWLLACALRAEKPRGTAGDARPEWLAWMTKAADLGWVEAQREAGLAFWDGTLGPAKSLGKEERLAALRRLIDAATRKDAKASATLRAIYADPANAPEQPEDALAFHLTGAKGGVPEAMLALGNLLAREATHADDPKANEAILWIYRAGNAGLEKEAALAFGRLTLRLAAGPPVNRRLATRARDAIESYLAKSPSDTGMMAEAAKAALLLDDTASAEKWLVAAEAAGNAECRRLLALLLIRQGKDGSTPARLLRKGMAEGDGEAALALGDWMLPHAQNQERKAQALECYLRGAELGNSACATKAARMIRTGQGAAADAGRAAALYRRAAGDGDTTAMLELAKLLIAENFNHGSRPEAHAWLRLASERGLARECAQSLADLETRMSDNERLISRRLQSQQAGKPRTGEPAAPPR